MNKLDCDSLKSDSAKVRSAISNLTLVNFRNYRLLKLMSGAPFIVLCGENGSGKTNILEAISFLSQGRGLRNAKLSEIKTFDFIPVLDDTPFFSQSGWTVSAQIRHNDEEFLIGTSIESQVKETDDYALKEVERRIVQVNGQKLSSQNELGNYLSLIWVTPQMDRLFIGGAQHRRSFLDRIVYAFDTDHARRLSSFENLYRQWLYVLKNEKPNAQWLSSLEEQMAGFGVAIAAARVEQVHRLNAFMEQNVDDIFPDVYLELDGTLERMVTQKPAVYVEDFYKESLIKQRRNILYNDSTAEVSKTDLKAYYKKKNMPANLCSTGEQKALLLSIILSQAKCLSANRGYAPILLLDEVAAHLDDFKRDAFLDKVTHLNTQCWLTTTSLFEFTHIKEAAQFFEVKDNTARQL